MVTWQPPEDPGSAYDAAERMFGNVDLVIVTLGFDLLSAHVPSPPLTPLPSPQLPQALAPVLTLGTPVVSLAQNNANHNENHEEKTDGNEGSSSSSSDARGSDEDRRGEKEEKRKEKTETKSRV